MEARGASLLLVSPLTPAQTRDFAQQGGWDVELLSDQGNEVARAYGVAFTLQPWVRPVYDRIGVDLPSLHGDERYELPVPATYVVDRGGVICHAFADADFVERQEPAEIVALLERLP